MNLTAAEWLALGFALGVLATWVWLLVAATFPRLWDRWRRRDRD
jgi:hypothetical protein